MGAVSRRRFLPRHLSPPQRRAFFMRAHGLGPSLRRQNPDSLPSNRRERSGQARPMGASYQPNLHSPLKFHTSLAAFEAGRDTPRAFLERCLETTAAREGVVRAWVALNESGARAQADASTQRWRSSRPQAVKVAARRLLLNRCRSSSRASARAMAPTTADWPVKRLGCPGCSDCGIMCCICVLAAIDLIC